MKKAFITAHFFIGKETDSMVPIPKIEGWDYIFFAYDDYKGPIPTPWSLYTLGKLYPSNVVMAKYVKWMTHKLLPEYDIIVWIDAFLSPNSYNISKLNYIVVKFLDVSHSFPLALSMHPKNRVDSYAEADACVSSKKINITMSNHVKDYLRKNGLERNSKVYWSCMIIKNNKNDTVIRLSEELFTLLHSICYRDQVWITLLFKKYKVMPTLIDASYFTTVGEVIRHIYV